MNKLLCYGAIFTALNLSAPALADTLPDSGKALLIASADTDINLTLPLTTRITDLDGKRVSTPWGTVTELPIEPGEHSLTLVCHANAQGIDVLGHTTETRHFEAGKTYVFTAAMSDYRNCAVELQTI